MGQKRTRPKPQRLNMARQWLPTYNGTKIVKGYKKKFAVDTMTAIRDLQEIGVQFEPDYISAVEAGEKNRIMRLQVKKQERLAEQNGIEELYDEMNIWVRISAVCGHLFRNHADSVPETFGHASGDMRTEFRYDTDVVSEAYGQHFDMMWTPIPVTYGQHSGNIRTLIRVDKDTLLT